MDWIYFLVGIYLGLNVFILFVRLVLALLLFDEFDTKDFFIHLFIGLPLIIYELIIELKK